MHEMSLCESILQIIEDEAQKQSFQKVSEVHLAVGTLAGVELDALRFSFDVVVQNSVADGACLHVHEVQAEGLCPACGSRMAMSSRYDACGQCGGFGLQLAAGDEMRITHLEVN